MLPELVLSQGDGSSANLSLRRAVPDDFSFAFAVKKDAMGPHIIRRWGWDEEYQLSVHRQRWEEKPWFIVLLDEKAIGTVSIQEKPEFVQFGEFYLTGELRGRGWGTALLCEFLRRCDKSKRVVRLEYLKWNPVGSLYRRQGFEVIAESSSHYFMERKPQAR